MVTIFYQDLEGHLLVHDTGHYKILAVVQDTPTYLRWGFTDRAAADIRSDLLLLDRIHHHGHGLWGAEPVAVVIARGQGAPIVDVTEHERHDTEPAHTAAWGSCG